MQQNRIKKCSRVEQPSKRPKPKPKAAARTLETEVKTTKYKKEH